MDSNNHETKLSNEPKHEGEEPLLSGEGDKETLEGQKPETEAKNEEQAAGAAEADDDDNYDYEGVAQKLLNGTNMGLDEQKRDLHDREKQRQRKI